MHRFFWTSKDHLILMLTGSSDASGMFLSMTWSCHSDIRDLVIVIVRGSSDARIQGSCCSDVNWKDGESDHWSNNLCSLKHELEHVLRCLASLFTWAELSGWKQEVSWMSTGQGYLRNLLRLIFLRKNKNSPSFVGEQCPAVTVVKCA